MLSVLGSHTVTYHQSEVNTQHTRLNARQTDGYSINVLQKDRRLSWPNRLVTYQDAMVYPPTDSHPSKN